MIDTNRLILAAILVAMFFGIGIYTRGDDLILWVISSIGLIVAIVAMYIILTILGVNTHQKK